MLSVLLGVIAAVRGGRPDRAVQFVSVLGTAVPSYIVAIALVFSAIEWPAMPATGYVSPEPEVAAGWRRSILPVVALLAGAVAGAAAQFRTAVLDTPGKDYVRTLESGIPERAVMWRHVLRNSAGPGMIALSLTVIALMGGTVFIEQVFALPGLGQMSVSSALISDVPMVMGTVLVTMVIVLVVNFLGDLAMTSSIRKRGPDDPDSETVGPGAAAADGSPSRSSARWSVSCCATRWPRLPGLSAAGRPGGTGRPVLAPDGPDVTELVGDQRASAHSGSPARRGLCGSGHLVAAHLGIAPDRVAALVVLVVSAPLGVTSGLMAGFYRGRFEAFAGFLADAIMSLPGVVLLIALYTLTGPNIPAAMAVFGVLVAPAYYRLVRSVALGIRNELYVDAARVVGLSDLRIVGRHVLWAVRAPVIIQSAFILAAGIGIEAGVSFLGLGDPAGTSWGLVLQRSFNSIYNNPGPSVARPGDHVTILALVLLGNALSDALQSSARSKVLSAPAGRRWSRPRSGRTRTGR